MALKILCIGSQWRGSDDGTLFKGFSKLGHLITIIDEKYFIPLEARSVKGKILRRLGAYAYESDYNVAICKEADLFKPDFACVFKGTYVREETIYYLKKLRVPVICFYPDISLIDHGRNIQKCVPLYNHYFTTKTFAIEEIISQFKQPNVSHINHMCDPDIHRSIDCLRQTSFSADVSFIGTYSLKKEGILNDLCKRMLGIDLKIWGGYWESSTKGVLLQSVQGKAVFGDLYAMAVSSSKINLGLLSEGTLGSTMGDQVTARTFQIPACGGFMLHERTDEFELLFKVGVEAEAFSTIDELVSKIDYYLHNEAVRRRIADAGRQKVLAYHTSEKRAEEIIRIMRSKGF